MQGIVRDRWIIYQNTLKIIVRRVVGIEECASNVRHVHARVRLACDVHFVSLQGKSVHEVLEPRLELRRDILFGRGGRRSLREASPDGLFHPYDVGQLVPRVRVLHGLEGSVLPQERAVLLQDALE